MSRIAAFTGPEIPLRQFLLDPEHSLFRQSWRARELNYADINVDGFGLGWYFNHEPLRYASVMPIWNDNNLVPLAKSMSAPVWFGYVRSATNGFEVNHTNTQPFHDELLMFAHDGFVDNFNHTLKPHCLKYISREVAADIAGNTDSEYLFALLRERLREEDHASIETALMDILSTLSITLQDVASLLNIIISDGHRLVAVRHATNHDCPSLYYCVDDAAFPPGSQLIASEPLTDTPGWQPVPDHYLLVLDPQAGPDLVHL